MTVTYKDDIKEKQTQNQFDFFTKTSPMGQLYGSPIGSVYVCLQSFTTLIQVFKDFFNPVTDGRSNVPLSIFYRQSSVHIFLSVLRP